MPDTVDLAVRWHEAGADVPTRTAVHLRNLKHAADDAAPSVGERMAQAFQRLEAREPTMVLRRSAFALEALAASSVAAQGPLGRLAATLPLLGGAWGIVAVAAFAAVGAAIHAVEQEAKDFREGTLSPLGGQLQTALLGPAAPFAERIAKLRLEQAELGRPGFWERAQVAIGGGGTAALVAERGVERARTGQLINVLEEAHAREQLVVQSKILLGVETDLAKARLSGGVVTNEMTLKLFDQETMAKEWAISLGAGDEPFKQRMLRLTDEARQVERNNLILQQHNEALKILGVHIPTAAEREAARIGGRVDLAPGMSVLAGPGLEGGGAPAGLDEFTRLARTRERLHLQGSVDAEGRFIPFDASQIGVLAPGGGISGITPKGQDELRRQADRQLEATKRLPFEIGTVMAGHMTAVVAAAVRGQPGGVVSGIGGLAGGLMSAVGSLPSQAGSLLGPVGAIVGASTAALGGLISLFSSGKPRVTITAFEEQALAEIRNLRADPLTTSLAILGSDPRATLYALNRLQRRDAQPRFG